MAAVSDSSPLILYARIERLDLLQRLFHELLIHPAVWREVITIGSDKIGSHEIQQATWILLQPLSDETMLKLPSALHAGEAEAIALASTLEPPVPIILDDGRARRRARDIGLFVIGSGGILSLAKRAGIISAVRPILDELLEAGLFLDAGIVQDILESVDER